jgi:hypothetical protein
VLSGCVTCADDVGLPQASNVGRRKCVSFMVEWYLRDTQLETVCAHDLCRERIALVLLRDNGAVVERVLA